ncbi:MAG: hypothetical protein WCK51_14370 [Armatimonadota bacterium]
MPKLFGLHFLVWAGFFAAVLGPLAFWGMCSSSNQESQFFGQMFVVYPSIAIGIVLAVAGLVASRFDDRK